MKSWPCSKLKIPSPTIPESWRRFAAPALLALCVGAWIGMGVGGCSLMPAPDFPGGDGPPRHAPDLSAIPDAVPRIEPRSRTGNPDSYVVFGRRYRVMDSSAGYVERGIASWYGRKFHGQRTSSGETYDMYRMSAAHKHLPLPTYVRVTNLDNRRSVVVRVNDRGPFHSNRIIDLSYAAASRLGMLAKGTARVEVRAIDPARPPMTRVAAAPIEALPPARAPAPTVEAGPIRATPLREASVQAANDAGPPAESDHKAAREAAPDTQATAPNFFLQAGAFSSERNARRLQAQLSRTIEPDVRVTPARISTGPVYRVRIGPLDSIRHADLLAAELKRLGVANTRVVAD